MEVHYGGGETRNVVTAAKRNQKKGQDEEQGYIDE